MIMKVGFGGGCHWCTEAVFASLKGVRLVEQGWIASDGENGDFSESVLVTFDTEKIPLETLIAIHLHTHSSTAKHSMRSKYRSAVYVCSEADFERVETIILSLKCDFENPIITKVLRYVDFKLNREDSLEYYFKNPEKPFCELYINPKLNLLLQQFSEVVDSEKLEHLSKIIDNQND